MDLSYEPLGVEQLAGELARLRDWSVEDGALTRLFKFSSYSAGLDFAHRVGTMADKLNHHPDIHVGYQVVRITTSTHETGGLTAFDVELARQINDLVH